MVRRCAVGRRRGWRVLRGSPARSVRDKYQQATTDMGPAARYWHGFCWLLLVASQSAWRAQQSPVDVLGSCLRFACSCARPTGSRGGQKTPMRTVIAFVVGIATAAVVVGLGVLVVQNTQSDQLTFLGTTFFVDKGGVVAGGVALGFGLAVRGLLPGRLAGA